MQMQWLIEIQFPAAGGCSIDEVILIDREVDCVTPLCTQLTYEGLLEETMGIKNGTVTLEKEGGQWFT